MDLSVFIRGEIEQILAEWDRFARSIQSADSDLSDLVLRDHAKEMLLAIAADIETGQSPAQQKRKSRGLAAGGGSGSAASSHGVQRHVNEFSLSQLAAEFRALRSTVLRLWLPQVPAMSERTVQQMVRFNESIDQALAESLVAYTDANQDARNLLLAVLGHDLRSPLATMSLAGELLARDALPAQQRSTLAHNVQRSARLMKSIVDDLLGYTRVQFGKGMPVEREWCDLPEILEAAIADARATHPQTEYVLHTTGERSGCFDGPRLHQLFMNLLVNAAQHGARSRPVTVDLSSSADRAVIRITNHGRVIPDAALESIFKPLVQVNAGNPSDSRSGTSLGLGLYIAREIAEGHGGSIEVKSEEVSGTVFTVDLPRDASCRS